MAFKKARVLAAIVFAGQLIPPNKVIEADASVIKGYGDSVDDTSAAVKYCLEHEGAEVIRLTAEEAPAANNDEAAAARANALAEAQAAVEAAQKAYDTADGEEAKLAAKQALDDAQANLLKLQ